MVEEGGLRVGVEPTIRLHVCCCFITKYICFVIFSFAPYCVQAGNTALLLALAAGHDDAAVTLIENGADVSCKNKVVWLCVGRVLQLSPRTRVLSCHHAATLISSFYCLRMYVRLRAPLVQEEKTALCFAAMKNCKLSLAMLIEKGADVNAADNVRTICFV